MRLQDAGWLATLLIGATYLGAAVQTRPKAPPASAARAVVQRVVAVLPQSDEVPLQHWYGHYHLKLFGWGSRPGYGEKVEVWRGNVKLYQVRDETIGLNTLKAYDGMEGPPDWHAFGYSVTGDGVPTVVMTSRAAWHQQYRLLHLGNKLHVVTFAGRESEVGRWGPPRTPATPERSMRAIPYSNHGTAPTLSPPLVKFRFDTTEQTM